MKSVKSLIAVGTGVAAAVAAVVVAVVGTGTTAGLHWYPGYYALGSSRSQLPKILADPLTQPFTGVQMRYFWSDSETSPGNFSAGYTALDNDLAAVAAKGKKLMLMLMIKRNDGKPAVPADLLPGGQIAVGSTSLAAIWQSNVSSRCQAWIKAMVSHAMASQYAGTVAGVVFNETSLPNGTTDKTLLTSVGYDPYKYMTGIQNNLLAVTNTSSVLPAFYYHEGGFVSMDGKSVNSGPIMGDWMLAHPHTGAGTPDAKSASPKGSTYPLVNLKYQGKIGSIPNVQSGDYAASRNATLQAAYDYMSGVTTSTANRLYGTDLVFLWGGSGAFTFADVSRFISTHPVKNTAVPPGW